jgi:hypothetical protein
MAYDLMNNKESHEVGRKNMKAVHIYDYGDNFFSVLMPSINLFMVLILQQQKTINNDSDEKNSFYS